jgi:chaperonin cofactor prefoldin
MRYPREKEHVKAVLTCRKHQIETKIAALRAEEPRQTRERIQALNARLTAINEILKNRLDELGERTGSRFNRVLRRN